MEHLLFEAFDVDLDETRHPVLRDEPVKSCDRNDFALVPVILAEPAGVADTADPFGRHRRDRVRLGKLQLHLALVCAERGAQEGDVGVCAEARLELRKARALRLHRDDAAVESAKDFEAIAEIAADIET